MPDVTPPNKVDMATHPFLSFILRIEARPTTDIRGGTTRKTNEIVTTHRRLTKKEKDESTRSTFRISFVCASRARWIATWPFVDLPQSPLRVSDGGYIVWKFGDSYGGPDLRLDRSGGRRFRADAKVALEVVILGQSVGNRIMPVCIGLVGFVVIVIFLVGDRARWRRGARQSGLSG